MPAGATGRHDAGDHPSRARRRPWAPTPRSAALAATALVTAALVAACGGSGSGSTSGEGKPTGKALDLTRVERQIEVSILSEKHMRATVTCPSYVEQRQGNNFTCYATGTARGKNGRQEPFRTPFTVEQVNDRGYVYFHS
jgi:hypothetical protein